MRTNTVATAVRVGANKFNVALLGKTKRAGPMTYVQCCADYRVFLMIFQYSACFGCELVMNNTLATHFHDAFGVDLVAAGALAMSFGAMNLFARSLGGILSDWMNVRWRMCGRLWAHFLSLLGQAIFLFLFGCITKDSGGWPVALTMLIFFAIFVNMAEGTSYGIVPYMIPEELAIVSAMVGAGGTLGAVIATWSFYKTNEDTLLPLPPRVAELARRCLAAYSMLRQCGAYIARCTGGKGRHQRSIAPRAGRTPVARCHGNDH